MADFKDHFSQGSANYAMSRPDYPPELAAFLAQAAPGRELALDCGCGTGQLSLLLAEHFGQVVGTDASAQQIRAASPHPRVTYRVAPAETSGLEPRSADLITAAQAAHWFEMGAFYQEARRVAKPGALLALITYGVLHVEGDAEPSVQDFYWKTIAPYWPPERRHVEAGYRSLAFPFEEIAIPPMEIRRLWTRDQFMDYVETWSAVRQVEKAGQRALVDAFAAQLAALWPDGEGRAVHWPITVRAAYVA
jgi:SAM-dependent methyltransferase